MLLYTPVNITVKDKSIGISTNINDNYATQIINNSMPKDLINYIFYKIGERILKFKHLRDTNIFEPGIAEEILTADMDNFCKDSNCSIYSEILLGSLTQQEKEIYFYLINLLMSNMQNKIN